jgi:hypothetical protein
VNPYAADDTPTGPIHGLVPRTDGHADLQAAAAPPGLGDGRAAPAPGADGRPLPWPPAELDRVAGLLSKLQAQLDAEVQNAEALGL